MVNVSKWAKCCRKCKIWIESIWKRNYIASPYYYL